MSAVLPEPPRDVSELVSLPSVRLEAGWRVFRAGRSPVFYFRGPSRFVPSFPDDAGVLYLADSMETALSEAFVRSRIAVTRSEIEGWALARVSIAHLRLADATGSSPVSSGLTQQIALAPDEGPSQRWAAALIDSHFDGIVYPSRLRSSGRIIAVFGAAGSTDPPEGTIDVRPVSPHVLEQLGTRVLPVPSDDELDIAEPE